MHKTKQPSWEFFVKQLLWNIPKISKNAGDTLFIWVKMRELSNYKSFLENELAQFQFPIEAGDFCKS